MKLELTRAEIAQVILDHIKDVAPYAKLDVIQDFENWPDTVVVTTGESNESQ
jgi:hypothetical protein